MSPCSSRSLHKSALSGRNPLKYVLLGLLHITFQLPLHASLHPILLVLFFTISPIRTFDFHCGWLAGGDSLREAVVPQWSTTLPLSLHAPSFPSLLPLDWTQIEGSAGYGQNRERAWRERGLSSHRRNGAGVRRLIASQSVTGKDICLPFTKPVVRQHPQLLTSPLCSKCVIKLTEMWAMFLKNRVWKRQT